MAFKELTKDQKKQMKETRLQNYRAMIYEQELNIVAYRAIGDEKAVEQCEKNIGLLKKSYAAIEAI